MIGAGGASAWRQARAQSLLKEGRCVLIWQYLAAVNRHLLEWRAGNESRLYAGGNLKQVMAFVRKAAPERIICNELVGWDRIEAVLTFLRALQSAGSRLEVRSMTISPFARPLCCWIATMPIAGCRISGVAPPVCRATLSSQEARPMTLSPGGRHGERF